MLAHRGSWSPNLEPNSLTSFLRAAHAGLGIELDIRDLDGRLVVSHDVPTLPSLMFENLLAELGQVGFSGILAINVKADGLVPLVHEVIEQLTPSHFFFDMSFPEQRRYDSSGLPIAVRVSEFEDLPIARMRVHGGGFFWLDAFESDWWLGRDWNDLFSDEDSVFAVSPELHGRDPREVWAKVARWVKDGLNVGICTDLPEDFLDFTAGI